MRHQEPFQFLHCTASGGISFNKSVDLFAGMHHGRVITILEKGANLLVAQSGQVSDQKHGNGSRHGVHFSAGCASHAVYLEAKMAGGGRNYLARI